MTASILGKRHRGAIETEASALPLRTSSKRRARAPQVHEEPTHVPEPLTRQLRSSRSRRNVDCLDQENCTDVKTVPSTSEIRVKHAVHDDQRASTSPAKINSHFQAPNSVNDENKPPVEIKTPSKARFRNALDTPPVTPKHRVQIGAKNLTPRTPRQTATPTAAPTIYSRARQLFARGANPARLIGRDAEREKLFSFLQKGLQSRKGGCLYVSGPPGTGKSAMVDEVCRDLDTRSVKVTHVNCVSMKASRDIFSKLLDDLCDDSQVFKKSETERLKAMFLPEKSNDDFFLVTLDEIDHLLTTDADVLQSLFEWSMHQNSRLLLVGIANALDLTDRSLPKLKSKNLKPQLLPFLPYSASQIATVISGRLRSLLSAGETADPNFVPFVQPAAIQLCSKKVASQTGDLRKAFELIRRAIDLVEQETLHKLEKQQTIPESPSKAVLAENNNLSSPVRPSTAVATTKQTSMSAYTALTAPRASIAHIAKITSSAFGQGTVQRLQGLNLQQKAAICALIALDRKRRDGQKLPMVTPTKSRNLAPTVKQLFEVYCALCRNDNILHPLTATEFKDVLGNLETMGLIGEVQGRGRGGTVAGGSTNIRRTPSKTASAPGTPSKGVDEQSLVCYVSQKEVESQLSGPGEGILRRLMSGEGL